MLIIYYILLCILFISLLTVNNNNTNTNTPSSQDSSLSSRAGGCLLVVFVIFIFFGILYFVAYIMKFISSGGDVSGCLLNIVVTLVVFIVVLRLHYYYILHKYINSDSFNSLCNNYKAYIEECNARYDTYLKDYENVKTTSVLPSLVYNTVSVSSSVYSKVDTDRLKYVCKYFNIVYSDKDYSYLLDIADFIHSFTVLREELIELYDACYYIRLEDWDCPKLLLKKRLIVYKYMGFKQLGALNSAPYPTLTFEYTSNKGNVHKENKVVFDDIMLRSLADYIKTDLNINTSGKDERAKMTKKLREYIKERDNYTCQCCGNSTYVEPNLLLEVDHIIPVSRGGKTELDNLQTLCWKCNRSKSNK